jgi:hypothetical protein
MAALQVVVQTGTRLAAPGPAIEAGIDELNGQFPCALLYIPKTSEIIKSSRLRTETHEVHLLYFDRWETSARTKSQLISAVRADLELMKQNVRNNRTLTVGGVAQAQRAGYTIETNIDDPVMSKRFGFYVISAELVIEVEDLWYSD